MHVEYTEVIGAGGVCIGAGLLFRQNDPALCGSGFTALLTCIRIFKKLTFCKKLKL
jgi:hypothetical protein